MGLLRKVLPLIFFFLVFALQASAHQESLAALCKSLPSDIQRQLVEKFGSWTIQQPKDLSATARERWAAEKPLDCPGVAAGRFSDSDRPSYAVLLVPKDHPEIGYKFLVFTLTAGRESYEMTVAEQSDHDGAANLFIHRIAISRFFDESSRRKFGVAASDGILLADAGEYETDVYFLANGGYRHQPVDY